MEVKKYPKADVNRYRAVFFNIGLIISLGFTYTAFEWKFYDSDISENTVAVEDEFDDLFEIPPTEQPPPLPPKQINVTIIPIENTEEIEDELEINFDIEMTDGLSIDKLLSVSDLENEIDEESSDEIFIIVEEQPQPRGGLITFYNHVKTSIVYPSMDRRMRIEGRVFVQFVVEKDGSLKEIEVLRGISQTCDAEAIRVVSTSAKWLPGKQRGKPVRVRMVLPISFKLN